MTCRLFTGLVIVACLTTSSIRAGEEPLEARLKIHADQKLRTVPPLLFGHNMEWVWGGQGLFKQDGTGAVDGLVPLVRQLRPALIRYPGGSLANTFRFADSIGPRAGRKSVANFFTLSGDWRRQTAAYKTETPLLGFDEFMRFVEQVDATGAVVTVNCTAWPHNPELSGSAQEAAAWVAYANAPVDAPPVFIGQDRRGTDWFDSQYWARRRAENGRARPYGVRHWEIGNEVYDADQGAGMNGDDYARRLVEYANLMKAVDKTIQIGAVIKEDMPAWVRPVVAAAKPPGVDFLVIHAYGPGPLGTELPFWSNGSKNLKFRVAAPGQCQLTVRAAGQSARGIGAQMELAVDGRSHGVVTADREQHDFTYRLDLSGGEHVLTISFLNDEYAPPEDRNLFIKDVSIRTPDGRSQRIELMSAGDVLQEMSAQLENFDIHLQRVREAQSASGAALPFHVTEFNALYGVAPELLRQSADLKSALYTAGYLQRFLETPDIEAANFWCIKSASFLIVQPGPVGLRHAPAGLVYQVMLPLMRGDVVRTEWLEQPRFKAMLGKGTAPWLTATAVRHGSQLAVSIINWHPTKPVRIELNLRGPAPTQTLTGPDPNAIDQEDKRAVVVVDSELAKWAAENVCVVPPVSLTTIMFNLERRP